MDGQAKEVYDSRTRCLERGNKDNEKTMKYRIQWDP